MVPFRGRLQFKQYLPGKSHKYGVKLFKLCDSAGYTYYVDIYSGKGSGETKDLVLKLVQPFLEAGRTLCVDNFYTSLPLSECLLSHKTHLIGILRANQMGLPKDASQARLKRGELIARENGLGTVIIKWHDHRDVLILSTKHTETMVTVKKTRRGVEVKKPQAVIYYNCKQGIDISDQLASLSHCC